MRIGHANLDAVAQCLIELPQLSPPRVPGFFVLAQFCVSAVGALEEQMTTLVLDRLVEHLLQRGIGFTRHLGETRVRGRANAYRRWHTKLYTVMYAGLQTQSRDERPGSRVHKSQVTNQTANQERRKAGNFWDRIFRIKK